MSNQCTMVNGKYLKTCRNVYVYRDYIGKIWNQSKNTCI